MTVPELSRREKRRQKLGIDCNDFLVWKNWEPGKQYTRQVLFKNIEADAQTISFKLPVYRNTFLTPFPEPVTLRSGMTFSLDITFSPSEVVEIHDSIEVTVHGKASFEIRLEGRIPYAKLRCTPRSHDFKLCAVGSSTTERVTLTNTGTVPLEFVWDVPDPFTIVPQQGFLKPNEPHQATIIFAPLEARPVFVQGVCRIATVHEVLAVIQLTGVGKYPHICFIAESTHIDAQSKTRKPPSPVQFHQISHTEACVDFGAVASGSVQTYELILENPSLVTAQVKVCREDDSVGCPFEISLPNGDGPLGSSVLHPPLIDSVKDSSITLDIPRGGRRRLMLTYKAKGSASCRFTNVFEVRAVSGNTLHVSATGMISTSHVTASTSYLNFGDVNLEELPTREEGGAVGVVQLKNRGRHATHYQIYGATPQGAFLVEPSCGTIEPQRSAYVKVSFHPTEPINYLRRMFIFVHNMLSGVLFVDLFGSAYNSVIRPPSFGLHEVEAFFMYTTRGIGFYTPLELDMLHRFLSREREARFANPQPNTSDQLRSFQHMQSMWRVTKELENSKNSNSTSIRRRASSIPIETMVRLLNHTFPCPFFMDAKPILTFEANGRPQNHTVTLRNDSSEAAIATWVVQKGSLFVVSPIQQKIPAGEQYVFQIALILDRGGGASGSGGDPSHASTMLATQQEVGWAQMLECYVSYVQMRSFRTIDAHLFIPPQCFLVSCLLKPRASEARQTPKQEHFLEVSSTTTTFTSTRVGGTTYQLISLQNLTDVFVSYEITNAVLHRLSEKLSEGMLPTIIPDPGTILQNTITTSSADTSSALPKSVAVFACSPSTGWIGPQKRGLIVYCFHPTSYAQFEADAILTAVCGRKVQSMKLRLLGESDMPRLIVTGTCMSIDSRQLFLKPTCVSGETRHELQLYNPTSLCIAYRLVSSPHLMRVLRFEPREGGRLSGGERSCVTVYFKPGLVSNYKGTVTLLLHDAAAALEENGPLSIETTPSAVYGRQSITWEVSGEGVYGKLQVEPTILTLEQGEANSLRERNPTNLTLYNSGKCELAYQVRVWVLSEPTTFGEDFPKPELYNDTGVLPARAHCTVLVTPRNFVSRTAGEYIVYVMMAGTADFSAIPGPQTLEEVLEHPHCKLTVRTRCPAVQVVDVRSLTQLRSSLWRRLSIDELNAQLTAPVHPNHIDPTFHAFDQYINGLMPIAMNLALGLQHALSTSISLVLENTGDCEASFDVCLPTEADVNQEAWFAEQENLAEIHHILDASLIEIKPRHGTIGIGESTVLTIIYRFRELGTHVLPAVLRISDGRRALMLLEGRTMPPDMSCLMFHHSSSVYHLQPVALGDMEPPMQSITVENPLDRKVTYRVDVNAIRAIAKCHYNFPILQCVAPEGTLAPYCMASVPWYFRPLEAIEYTMHVPIYTDSGECYTITLIGRGYHPHTTSTKEVCQWIDKSFFAIPPGSSRNPRSSSLSLNEAPVFLSTEVMTFGAVPFHALYRRCCTLTNCHPTDVYSFKWIPCQTNGDHTLVINPSEGVIPPKGGRMVCRIAFHTGSVSQQLAWPILCLIANKTAMGTVMQEGASADASPLSEPAVSREECIAADGLGLLACGAARASVSKGGLQLSTLFDKKARIAPPRMPVVAIPPESMSVHALSRLVTQTRQQYEDNMLEPSNAGKGGPIYGTLELFLQARIMSIDCWEMLYEQNAKLRVYQPAMHFHIDPQLPDISAPATMDELQVTRNVLDEMIHMIIEQPQVQSAFTQPFFVEEPVYYRDLPRHPITVTSSLTTQSSTGCDGVNDQTLRPKEQIPPRDKEVHPTGLLKSTLEVALDELILEIATNVVDNI